MVRWTASLVIVALIGATWWLTVVPPAAAPEIGGLYSFRRVLLDLFVTVAGLSAIYLVLGRQSARIKVQSIVLGAATVGFCLLLLESPVFLFGYNSQTLFGVTGDNTALHLSKGVNRRDPVLIHLHWPHSSFSGEVTGNLAGMGIPRPTRYKVDVRYDRNGFRNDREYTQADIAVIGDSFVEAAIMPREKSLVALLESRLGRPTVNLGQIAYGLRQELEVVKRFALPLSPKLVLWVLFGGNDLRDVRSYEQQLSRFDEPAPPVRLQERLFLRNALVATGKALMTVHAAWRREPSRQALNHSGLFRRADGTMERVYFGQTADPWTPHQWTVATDTLREANRLSRESGADFVVVYVSRKFRLYRRHLALTEGTEIAGWTVNRLPRALADWCAKNDVRFIDTGPHLEALVANGSHPHLVDDVHWNALGHETAARAIVDYLAAARLFPFRAGTE